MFSNIPNQYFDMYKNNHLAKLLIWKSGMDSEPFPSCGVENDGVTVMDEGGAGVLSFLGRTFLVGEKLNQPSRMVV